jgi:phosphatidylglycerol---prolipoprotein diacylglyceryl transferase
MNIYHYLPFHINPIIFSIGSFSIRWYSVMYLVAFAVVYFLLNRRIKKGEGSYSKDIISGFLLYGIFGLLVGARMGYVLFYNPAYYFHHLLEIIVPTSNGISGMSYYGGLIGIILAALFFVRKNKLDFWKFADFIIPAIPAGYLFGRIGNFLNGELYGRATNSWIGMYFPLDNLGLLRHPSQLYEAFFEGIVLFIILWFLRNRSRFSGYLLAVYLFGYGFFRFLIEFFRQPDPQIGLIFRFLTLGQIFSLAVIAFAITIYYLKYPTYQERQLMVK